jgi:hypothetical protein
MIRRTKICFHFYFFLLDPVVLLAVPDSLFREEEDFSTVRFLVLDDRVDFISPERLVLLDLTPVVRLVPDGFFRSVLTFDLLWVLRTVVELRDGIGWSVRTVEVDVLVPEDFT